MVVRLFLGWFLGSWGDTQYPHTGSCPGEGPSECPAAPVSLTSHSLSSCCSTPLVGWYFSGSSFASKVLKLYSPHAGQGWFCCCGPAIQLWQKLSSAISDSQSHLPENTSYVCRFKTTSRHTLLCAITVYWICTCSTNYYLNSKWFSGTCWTCKLFNN